MHLRSFEYFRAVTIVLIVVGHCYGISGWNIQSFGDRVLANLVSGGTSLFVFISGFLFHHVFYPKFEYKTFVKKKFMNVYVPYLILAFVPVCMSLYMRMPYVEYYFGPEDTIYDQIIRPALLYYWHGGVLAYWYIPFIMAMFLISPVFIWFIRQSTRNKIYMVVATSLIALFVHRPVNNWSVIQSIIYFSPVYMFGILCSMEKEWIYKNLKSKDVYLFFAVVFFALLQAYLTQTSGNLQKTLFSFNGIDVSFIQKILLCVFFMIFLHRFENKDFPLLKQLAASSFAIYFLHGWFIYIIWLFKDFVVPKELYTPYLGLHLLPLIATVVISLSYVTARRVKKAFPNKSRMIIGW